MHYGARYKMTDIERLGNKSVDERLDSLEDRLGKIEEMIAHELDNVDISEEQADKLIDDFLRSLQNKLDPEC